MLLFRFVRLAILLGGATWLLVWAARALGADQPDPSQAMLLAVELGVLGLLAILGDVAQVRMAVEDRRSVVSALGASWRFVSRHLPRILALYAVNTVLAVAVIWLLRQIALEVDPDRARLPP